MAKKFNYSTVRVKNEHNEYEDLPALRGSSSYELAVQNGFEGTEAEWMELMIGDGWVGKYQELEANKADRTELAECIKTEDFGNLHTFEFTDLEGNSSYVVTKEVDAYVDGRVNYTKEHWELSELKTDLMIYRADYGPYAVYYVVDSDEKIAVDTNGVVSMVSPGEIVLYYDDTDSTLVAGKYISLNYNSAESNAVKGVIYYIPSDATIIATHDGTAFVRTIDKYYEVIGYPESYDGNILYIGPLDEAVGKTKTVATASYLSFVGNVNTEMVSAALGKNNEKRVKGLGMALAMYAWYKGSIADFSNLHRCNTIIDISKSFPAKQEIFNDSMVYDLLFNNDYIKTDILTTIHNLTVTARGDSTAAVEATEETIITITQDDLDTGCFILIGTFSTGSMTMTANSASYYSKLYINDVLVADGRPSNPVNVNQAIRLSDYNITEPGEYVIKQETRSGNGKTYPVSSIARIYKW